MPASNILHVHIRLQFIVPFFHGVHIVIPDLSFIETEEPLSADMNNTSTCTSVIYLHIPKCTLVEYVTLVSAGLII